MKLIILIKLFILSFATFSCSDINNAREKKDIKNSNLDRDSTRLGIKTKFIFSDFFNENVKLYLNNDLIFQGQISTGTLSDASGAIEIQHHYLKKECNEIKVISDNDIVKKNICINLKVKSIFISGGTRILVAAGDGETGLD
jgi:hypothetical protein